MTRKRRSTTSRIYDTNILYPKYGVNEEFP
ncbi:protein of unknown function [Paraburkholderia dioscoreae]|uniref:Uncharacterized protein n=1 Tax=Paraburkholderia dioscoreae TaxID=2604047 RepID=A0A5Q4ZI35_9BURK|nr:protein of unknown function [Paraburkholderia dioscoreae]